MNRPSAQASRVLAAFGGARALFRVFCAMSNESGSPPARSLKSIYCWTYGRERGGTGGLIPADVVPSILEAAKRARVKLSSDDWNPEER